MEELTYLQDPGHGWIRCPITLAEQLGFAARVSPYSYHQTETGDIWLEEDCDAALLIEALRERGIAYRLHEIVINGDAVVRSFRRWGQQS